MKNYVSLMFCFASTMMCSTVFSAIDDGIPQSSQHKQTISKRIATGQIENKRKASDEIEEKTQKNYDAKSLSANLETNQDLNKLVEIKNIRQLLNDINVMNKETGDTENRTDGNRKITNRQLFEYRKITYGKVVSGVCKYGFVMIQMRFREDQAQSALIDHIVEPPATSRCLSYTYSIELLVGQTVALARDAENNFEVIGIKN